MPKRLRSFFLVIWIFCFAAICFAAEVTYTVWEDEKDQVWIRIQNGLDQGVKVESISLIFYDSKGKIVHQEQFPCNEYCLLEKHDANDFGPYKKPSDSESCRLQKVRYTVQK